MHLISVCYLYKRHLGARNLSDWEGVKYLFHSLKCKSMHFSGFCCCYSVSHCSKKHTIKIIDWSFICQWANVQNQQGIKNIYPSLYAQKGQDLNLGPLNLQANALPMSIADFYNWHKLLLYCEHRSQNVANGQGNSKTDVPANPTAQPHRHGPPTQVS